MPNVQFIQRSSGVEVHVSGDVPDAKLMFEENEELANLAMTFVYAIRAAQEEQATGYRAKKEPPEEPSVEEKARRGAVRAQIQARYGKRK